MHQITYEYEGIIYTAEYEVLEDELVIYLPDGSTHSIMLRGLKPEPTVMPYLVSYAKKVALVAK